MVSMRNKKNYASIVIKNPSYQLSGALSPSSFSIQMYNVMLSFQGRLVYAGHGEYLDYLQLRAINISVTGAIVLIRHGKSTDSRKVSSNYKTRPVTGTG